MYFNFDLKGLIPALLVMTVFSIIGIWKLIEVIIIKTSNKIATPSR